MNPNDYWKNRPVEAITAIKALQEENKFLRIELKRLTELRRTEQQLKEFQARNSDSKSLQRRTSPEDLRIIQEFNCRVGWLSDIFNTLAQAHTSTTTTTY